jgi:hypothetical protein
MMVVENKIKILKINIKMKVGQLSCDGILRKD